VEEEAMSKFAMARWKVGGRVLAPVALVLGAASFGVPGAQAQPSAAGADFAAVPLRDPLYRHLATLRRVNLLRQGGAGAKAGGEAPQSLTRYEMALETGRAVLALEARTRNGSARVGASSLEALSALLRALRPELRRLDVDVDAALALCERSGRVGLAARPSTQDRTAPETPSRLASRVGSEGLPSTLSLGQSSLDVKVPLSQRLRVYAALSSLAREAQDPFRDPSASSSLGRSRPSSELSLMASRLAGSRSSSGGAALDVSDWLRVRADVERRGAVPASRTPLGLRLSPAADQRAVGVGVDVATPIRGLTLSGSVARVGSLDPLSGSASGLEGTRSGVGVGISGWRNQLALSVNLSRLVPEDSAMLASSAAAFNLDLRRSDRVNIRFLYQQMFGPTTRGERVFSGGINISF
jgi:hypothetical protein